TSSLPKPKINIMLPRITSIWQRDSQPNASGRPGAVHPDCFGWNMIAGGPILVLPRLPEAGRAGRM
ncbi:hypothetical protein, partial [Sphingomonas sp.]|uniref:hypothetical protein n=1 Tax=Sphingomonas sp. TaxID=28214 RepID=UPI0035B293DA